MATKNNAAPESGGSDPSGFDFNAYVAGASSFPTFSHTVFLDQEGGVELHRVSERYDKLVERRSEILDTQERMAESPTRSLVDEAAEELSAELSGIERKCSELSPQISDLHNRVASSSLRLHFQSGTAEKLGRVVRQAEKNFHKKHGKKDDSDVEYITARSKALLAAQLAAYCTGITLADGTYQEAPNENGFNTLLDSLISSESVRLMTTLNQNLDSSADWANKVDAGFPGGRDQSGSESVGYSNPEDSKGLVASSDDPDDGRGNRVD